MQLTEQPVGVKPRTMLDKIWEAHRVPMASHGDDVLYVDRHLLNEVTSPQAFAGLRARGVGVRRPDLSFAVPDHNVTTAARSEVIHDAASRLQVNELTTQAAAHGIPVIDYLDERQGIVHVVAPELGLTLPGMTIVCGDSHTSTHGAFGALAFGIGTSEVEMVLATQTIRQRRPRSILVDIRGELQPGTTAKDVILALIARIGAAGGAGAIIEYAGPAIEAMTMEERMTVCNMSIEAGARAGLIAPDDTTFAYLRTRPGTPKGKAFDEAVHHWRNLRSDRDAVHDESVALDIGSLEPMVTWGTNSATGLPIGSRIPSTGGDKSLRRMLDYMGLAAGEPIEGLPIDIAFIGSCTNGRIEDLRAASAVAATGRVAPNVRALVVPGSGTVRRQAESEGLHSIFLAAGFEWRNAGCSMCLGMNEDRLAPGQRCASSSNRSFEGRQGPGGRTHLMSPAMVAAAAITGFITDVRRLVSNPK